MNKSELEQELIRIGIRKDFYSLNGGLPSEAFCLHENTSSWEVYYSEKGQKSQYREFSDEEDACIYFLDFITSDEVVMSNLEL